MPSVMSGHEVGVACSLPALSQAPLSFPPRLSSSTKEKKKRQQRLKGRVLPFGKAGEASATEASALRRVHYSGCAAVEAGGLAPRTQGGGQRVWTPKPTGARKSLRASRGELDRKREGRKGRRRPRASLHKSEAQEGRTRGTKTSEGWRRAGRGGAGRQGRGSREGTEMTPLFYPRKAPQEKAFAVTFKPGTLLR